MAVLAAIVPALPAGPHYAAGWINVVVLTAGVVMVYSASNAPAAATEPPARPTSAAARHQGEST